jgi:hypothetical protein
VSEQDFFFDEDPEPDKTPGKSSKPAAPAPSAKLAAKSAAPAQSAAPASFADGSTTWAVASLLAVAGVLLGAILGFLLGTGMAKSASVSTPGTGVPAAVAPATSGQPSTLTSEQVQSGLPAGHPDISTPTSGSANTTP